MCELFLPYIRFSFIGIQIVEYVRRILLAQAGAIQHHPAVVVDEDVYKRQISFQSVFKERTMKKIKTTSGIAII